MRRPKTKVGRFVESVFYFAIHKVIGGWALMLLAEVAHAYWFPALPTLTYWPAVLIVLLVGAVVVSVHPPTLTYSKDPEEGESHDR